VPKGYSWLKLPCKVMDVFYVLIHFQVMFV
jgi:hypothetical protein